ncbi:hypothetical protein [Zhihengliuella halotolerans]|uniref:hypothetical protein n=1 Tax=Zhihengliuella halotolerans TaxID=370736 RepID=UPI000C80AB01|nr:hypothetical protein [Zhihengliuella halotolerans]
MDATETSEFDEAMRSVDYITGGDFVQKVRCALQDVRQAVQMICEASLSSRPETGSPEWFSFMTYRLLNACAAIKMYDEHARIQIERRTSKDSPEVRQLAAIFSETYDAHLSYRLLFKLRNILVHTVTPGLIHFRVEHELLEPIPNGGTRSRVQLTLNRSTFSTLPKVAPSIRNEVAGLDSDPDLIACCRQVSPVIEALHDRVLPILRPELEADLDTLTGFYREARALGGSPILLRPARFDPTKIKPGDNFTLTGPIQYPPSLFALIRKRMETP